MRLLPRRMRARRDWLAVLLVISAMTAFVAVVYVVIVLGGGALIGHTDSPQLGLSVLATAVVALAFEPVQGRVERFVLTRIHGGRASAYDVLSRFSDQVTGLYGDRDVPVRIAHALAEGTGAEWAQVWLVVNERPVLAGSWPSDAEMALGPPGDAEPAGRRSLAVALAGEQLGVLRLQEHDKRPLTPVEERLFGGLAAQAGLVLHGARLRAELAQRLVELSSRADELRMSRERLVDTQDAERRRLERDIHDGAQQHLVALAVNLRLAQTLAAKSPSRARGVLDQQVDATATAIQTLVELSQGIYPRVLGDDGIGPALRAAVASSVIPVSVSDETVGRYSEEIESAAYFCCLEALQNAAKHSGASQIAVELAVQDGILLVEVVDNGHGFDPDLVPMGEGLANMRDRIDSAGGALIMGRVASGGTRVSARLPVMKTAAVV